MPLVQTKAHPNALIRRILRRAFDKQEPSHLLPPPFVNIASSEDRALQREEAFCLKPAPAWYGRSGVYERFTLTRSHQTKKPGILD